MMPRFDLEDAIMQAWQTESDLKLFLEILLDKPENFKEDDIANTVLGLAHIHSLRMEKLWDSFTQTFNIDEHRSNHEKAGMENSSELERP